MQRLVERILRGLSFLVLAARRTVPTEVYSATVSANSKLTVSPEQMRAWRGKFVYFRAVTADVTLLVGRTPASTSDGYLIRTTDPPHEMYFPDVKSKSLVAVVDSGGSDGTLIATWRSEDSTEAQL
jgi:hypothetical protein